MYGITGRKILEHFLDDKGRDELVYVLILHNTEIDDELGYYRSKDDAERAKLLLSGKFGESRLEIVSMSNASLIGFLETLLKAVEENEHPAFRDTIDKYKAKLKYLR